MNDSSRTRSIERVVVPLDAVSDSRAAVDTAARLAASARAPLHGVFVEDEDLLQLARLPFARQITLGTGAERLTTEHVELHQRAAAERARRELYTIAGQHGVECTFEVVRGASERAVSGASERDLVVAGGQTRPIGEHFRLECRWWSSIAVTPGPFLLVRHAWTAGGSVVMLMHNLGPAAARLLAAVAELAQARDLTLTVICPPAVADRDSLARWIDDRLPSSPIRLQIEVAPAEPAELRARIAALGCRLLAIEAEAGGGRLREFTADFACDILTVR